MRFVPTEVYAGCCLGEPGATVYCGLARSTVNGMHGPYLRMTLLPSLRWPQPRQRYKKIVRKPDDYQRYLYQLLDKPAGFTIQQSFTQAPRAVEDIVKDFIGLYDTLLASIETDETFDPEKNMKIMERYDTLKLEFWQSVAYCKRRGISLRGLRGMVPFEV